MKKVLFVLMFSMSCAFIANSSNNHFESELNSFSKTGNSIIDDYCSTYTTGCAGDITVCSNSSSFSYEVARSVGEYVDNLSGCCND